MKQDAKSKIGTSVVDFKACSKTQKQMF